MKLFKMNKGPFQIFRYCQKQVLSLLVLSAVLSLSASTSWAWPNQEPPLKELGGFRVGDMVARKSKLAYPLYDDDYSIVTTELTADVGVIEKLYSADSPPDAESSDSSRSKDNSSGSGDTVSHTSSEIKGGLAKVRWIRKQGVKLFDGGTNKVALRDLVVEVEQKRNIRRNDHIPCSSNLGHKEVKFSGFVTQVFDDGLMEIKWLFRMGQPREKLIRTLSDDGRQVKKAILVPGRDKRLHIGRTYWYPKDVQRVCHQDKYHPVGGTDFGVLTHSFLKTPLIGLTSQERARVNPDPSYLGWLNQIVWDRASKACITQGYYGATSFPYLEEGTLEKTEVAITRKEGRNVVLKVLTHESIRLGGDFGSLGNSMQLFSEKVPPLYITELYCMPTQFIGKVL